MIIDLDADGAIIGHARKPVSKQTILAIIPISMTTSTSRLRIPLMRLAGEVLTISHKPAFIDYDRPRSMKAGISWKPAGMAEVKQPEAQDFHR